MGKNTGDGDHNVDDVVNLYSIQKLKSASCKQLPEKVPPEIEGEISDCLSAMVYTFTVSRAVLLKDYGYTKSRIAKKTDLDHVKKLLDAPRRHFLT